MIICNRIVCTPPHTINNRLGINNLQSLLRTAGGGFLR